MPVGWRLIKTKHRAHAYTGEGARRFGGRWNSPGTRVVYTSESVALALLEMVVHLESAALLERYALGRVDVPDGLVERVAIEELPKRWRRSPPPRELQAIGDAWVLAQRSVALQVPSVIVPLEHNLLLNPMHPEFHRLTLGDPRPFPIDLRLLQ